MPPREPPNKTDTRPKRPRWSSPLWYLPIMVLMLWLWQGMVNQFAYRNIPYSEFKGYLQRQEVLKCVIRQDDIQGQIQPKPSKGSDAKPASATKAPNQNNSPASAKPFLFRTVRVEDPKLVDELQSAGVSFQGERPSFISQ